MIIFQDWGNFFYLDRIFFDGKYPFVLYGQISNRHIEDWIADINNGEDSGGGNIIFSLGRDTGCPCAYIGQFQPYFPSY